MCDIKPINTIIFVENMLCIYRNYIFYGENAKRIRILRVIVDICLYAAITVVDLIILYHRFQKNLGTVLLIFLINLLFFGYSTLCMINGIRQTNYFKELIDTFRKLRRIFDNDITYNKSLNCLNLKFIVASVTYSVMIAAEISHDKINHKLLIQTNLFDIFVIWVKILRWYRLVSEYLVYSILATILHKVFKRFNENLDKMQTTLHENITKGGNMSDRINLKIIKESSEMYTDLVVNSKAFRKCFGEQIVAAFAVSTIYSIVIFYRMWNMLLNGYNVIKPARDDMLLINLLFSVTCQIVVMIIAMVAAQRIKNEARMLRVILARLYNNLSIYPNRPEPKKIRDFSRMTLKNPVEINSVSELGVGMALLPTCVSIAVSYVIIMLQFNHTV